MTPASEAPEREVCEGIWRLPREEEGPVSGFGWRRDNSGVGSDFPGWGQRPEVQKEQEEGRAQGSKAPRGVLGSLCNRRAS